MDNKDIIEKVLNEKDHFQNKSASELRAMLDNELSKLDNQIDYGVVDELTTAVIEAEENKRLTADVDAELNNLRKRISKRRIIHFPKWAVSLSVACFILLCANCISVCAWNMNIVSAVIEFTKSGFTVEFIEPEKEIVELPTSEDDPYGLISKLDEYDIKFETPYYIPDGFVLTEIETNVNEDFANSVCFVFQNGKQNFSIEYTRFWDNVVPICVPSDRHNIFETTINDAPAIVSEEDGQYTITYQKDKTNFFFFSVDVPYSECKKIIKSIK